MGSDPDPASEVMESRVPDMDIREPIIPVSSTEWRFALVGVPSGSDLDILDR